VGRLGVYMTWSAVGIGVAASSIEWEAGEE
jgi:hypothetical protein